MQIVVIASNEVQTVFKRCRFSDSIHASPLLRVSFILHSGWIYFIFHLKHNYFPNNINNLKI